MERVPSEVAGSAGTRTAGVLREDLVSEWLPWNAEEARRLRMDEMGEGRVVVLRMLLL